VPPLGQQKVSTSETQSAVHPNDGSQHVGPLPAPETRLCRRLAAL